ncbi:MAG: LUD domain-containing protein [Thermodesulfobacteriota bacterium]
MKTRTDLLIQLENELTALQARTYRAGSKEELLEILDSLLSASSAQRVALENRSLIHDLNLEKELQKEGRDLLGFSPRDRKGVLREKDWEAVRISDVGIGGADYALADTGTLVLFSAKSSGRWVSLAPDIHIVLLPVERILASLNEILDQLSLEKDLSVFGSAVIFITGASRTADIELKLVMGAHGPKELHVVTLLFPTPGD